MRITDINHAAELLKPLDLGDGEVSHLKVRGAGVDVTLIQREGGIDITVNPTGEDYMHNVKTNEVYASSTQVRISRAKGSPLG